MKSGRDSKSRDVRLERLLRATNDQAHRARVAKLHQLIMTKLLDRTAPYTEEELRNARHYGKKP